MKLNEPSEEQQNIIELFKHNNIIVEAGAGSGKTTTCLHLAKSNKKLKMLLLTYNKKLKFETREKVDKLRLHNTLETHSYHSFCVKYYDDNCFTDYELIRVIDKNYVCKKMFKYDVIIIDEAQDINPLYYKLICKIFNDNQNKNTKICVLGNIKQSIYGFNEADYRFIVYADTLFNFNNLPWKKCKLSVSYRLTDKMADSVNFCLNENYITSDKKSKNKPRYIICNVYKNKPYEEIKNYLEEGYKPSEIFVLAPSIKSEGSPIRQLANLIKKKLKINIHVPTDDEEKLDEDILKNKLVFSTFHQVKGLERKVIIVFNFDDSYFKFYKPDLNKDILPNEMFVAITRGKEKLSVFHDYRFKHFNFINISNLNNYFDLIEERQLELKNNTSGYNEVKVSDLTRNLPCEVLNNLLEIIKISTINQKDKKIDIKSKINFDDYSENTSDILGIAFPSYYEYVLKQSMTILDELKQTGFCFTKILTNDDIIPKNIYDINTIQDITIEILLYLSNCYCSYRNGLYHKVYQVKDYNWINNIQLEQAMIRMSKLNISSNASFEKNINVKYSDDNIEKKIKGRIDCYDENNIYEFKCVQSLEKEHIVQLAIYMYANETQLRIENTELGDYIINNYYLYNILTEEMIKIECNYKDLYNMMEYLMNYKYNYKKTTIDNEFIENMLNWKQKYFKQV